MEGLNKIPIIKIILIFIPTMLVVCCIEKKTIKLKPLHPYSIVNSRNINNRDCNIRIAFFSINASINDSSRLNIIIDSLIVNMPDSLVNNYCISSIEVFEENDKINERFISTNKDHPVSFYEELLFSITWNDGALTSVKWFKDGLFISPVGGVEMLPVEENE